MEQIRIPLLQVVNVKHIASEAHPFNLQFPKKRLALEVQSVLTGSGIYLISYRDEAIYVGKYQPMKTGKIVQERWSRHLQTITGRGFNLGFGGRESPQQRLNVLLSSISDPRLRAAIQCAHDVDPERRFKDTGNNTSANRLRFASEKWEQFQMGNSDTILVGLEIRYFRIAEAQTQADASRQVSEVEKLVRAEYKLICNSDYRHERDSNSRNKNTVSNLRQSICENISEVSGANTTHCIALI